MFVVIHKEEIEKQKKYRKLKIKLLKEKITDKEFIRESKKLGSMHEGDAKNFSAYRILTAKRIAKGERLF